MTLVSDKIIILFLLVWKKVGAFTLPTPQPQLHQLKLQISIINPITTLSPQTQKPPCHHTKLFAGFGKPSSGSKPSKSKSKKTSDKKKLQIQQRTLKAYGGDIARGTQERITSSVISLPPLERAITDAYRTVTQFTTLTPAQKERLRPVDLQKFQAAKTELDNLLEEYGWTERDAHNVMQRITWDASADAKAARAITGSMPEKYQKRVERACEEIADAVKNAAGGGGKRGRCLDVGCGHGTLVPELTRMGVGVGQIVGVDLSPEMIRNAEERYRGVTFLAGDFLGDDLKYLPAPDNNTDDDDNNNTNAGSLFDGIIFCSSLHDLPDMQTSLSKASSLLKPNGIIVILHAQGSDHVMGQHRTNPVLVKRGLPAAQELEDMVIGVGVGVGLGLELVHKPADVGSEREEDEGYLAILKKVA